MSNRILSTSRGTNTGAFSSVDWVLFGSLGLIWGSSFLLMAIGLDAFHPGLVGLLRVVAAAALFALLPATRRISIDRQDWPRIALLSITWVALPFTLFPIAQQWIASGVAGMLNGTTPIFAAVIGAILLRSAPGRLQRIGLVVGLLGVGFITLPANQNGSNELLGIALALIASASYGLSVTLAVPLLQKYGSLAVMSRMVWVAAPVMLPFGLFALGRSTFAWPSFLATVAVGVLGTCLAFILMGKLAGRVGSTRASIVTYAIPVVALLLGAIVRDEVIAPMSIVGVVFVITGAALASRKDG